MEMIVNNSLRMERECVRQWLFSFNTCKKKVEKRGNLMEMQGGRFCCNVSHRSLPLLPEKTCLSPATHRLGDQLHHAIGGNLIEHCNQYVRTMGAPTTEMVVAFPPSPQEKKKKESLIKSTFYSFQHKGGDFVAEQIRKQHFSVIYSLDEKARAGTKRERINDDYRNQLAECKKLGFLYGDLPKKTLVRAMGRAQEKGGDVDSHFLSALEARLDVALKRAFFFPTIKAARQWIKRGKLCVNNQPKTFSSYLLQPGDFITIHRSARCLFRKQFVLGNNPTMHCEWNQYSQGTQSGSGGGWPSPSIRAFRRRFAFSSRLMQKWKEWSALWGHSRINRQDQLPQHQWGKGSCDFFLRSAGWKNNSAASGYLSATDFLHIESDAILEKSALKRPKTLITNWFHRIRGRETESAQLMKKRSEVLGEISRQSPPLLPEKVREYAFKCLEQQCRVIDGLYPQRWNRIFAMEKSSEEKKNHWRWSCIKPLHLECSYKHYTCIFLYAPQKLAWPSSINLFLLKKVLREKGK